MTLLEETLGEAKVRLIATVITIVSGFSNVIILYHQDETISGLMVTYTDDPHAVAGEKYLYFNVLKNLYKKNGSNF